MSQFLMTYLGGNAPATPEEGMAQRDKYMQWLADLGERAISPANPIKDTHLVTREHAPEKSSRSMMSGFSIIEVESMAQALDIADSCPFLDIGGSIEVSQIINMTG